MILLTGVTGTTGRATLQALLPTGVPLRVLVRPTSSFVAPPGVEVAHGDFADDSALDRALSGVDRAFLVSPSSPRQVELEAAFIAAATRAGLRHLVRLSAQGVEQPGCAERRLHAPHAELERILRASGLPWTLLRPNTFMQNLLHHAPTIAAQGALFSPLSPTARVAYVDPADIGAVAALALTEPGHAGRIYTLTGPAALNDEDIAAVLTAVVGRPIRYVQIPWEALGAALRQHGLPAWHVEGALELMRTYEDGLAERTASDIPRLLGRPARSVADFARAHQEAWEGRCDPVAPSR